MNEETSPTGAAPSSLQRHAFAANPSEHVYHAAIISTFFPHLGRQRSQQLRWILLGGLAVIVLIGLSRLVPIAIVAAALLVPVLYLLYFYDVQIYEDEPLPVLAATFVLGAVLGAGLSLAFFPLIRSLYRPFFGPKPEFVILTGIGIPLLAQALMLVGPLLLFFFRPRFDEMLDGLAFGVASGLGFAAAQTIIYSWLPITGPLQQAGSAISWALPLLRIGLLVPLLDAATTGLICAALWLRRDPQPVARNLGPFTSVPLAILIAALGQVVPATGVALLGGQVIDLFWYGGTLLVLILAMRHVLHVGLIAKARELGHGGTLRCPHCFHEVPDVPFCPHCGLAMRSTARRARRPLSA
jgi:PrsW family intramembrane metalloprotease